MPQEAQTQDYYVSSRARAVEAAISDIILLLLRCFLWISQAILNTALDLDLFYSRDQTRSAIAQIVSADGYQGKLWKAASLRDNTQGQRARICTCAH